LSKSHYFFILYCCRPEALIFEGIMKFSLTAFVFSSMILPIAIVANPPQIFFSEAAMKKLETMIPSNPFVISAERVNEMVSMSGLEVEELLIELIPIAKRFARPPISNYQVGVAALGKSGNIYLGVNLEFSGQPLNATVHGEQFLIVNARNHGETEIVAMALSAAPCGHCRQFLNEIVENPGLKAWDCISWGGDSNPSPPVFLKDPALKGGVSSVEDEKGQLQILIPNTPPRTLSSLLPEAFGPKNLGLAANLFVLPDVYPPFTHESPLVAEALRAACASYAPYSHSKSGVAIHTSDGKIYSGSCLENAAFNPSLSPLQAALVALVTDLRRYDEIVEVVLVERSAAKISYERSARALLKNIAPDAQFHLENREF